MLFIEAETIAGAIVEIKGSDLIACYVECSKMVVFPQSKVGQAVLGYIQNAGEVIVLARDETLQLVVLEVQLPQTNVAPHFERRKVVVS